MEVVIPSPSKRSSRLSRYLLSDIHIELNLLVECELLLLTFTTGMQDAVSFPDFHCFASNQTGNTVLLATVAAGLTGTLVPLPNIAVSLVMFLVGGLVMGQIGNIVGRRRRLWLLLSSTLQTAMVFEASAIQSLNDEHPSEAYAIGVIALLAFSAGAQVAMGRGMEMPEITTAMATAAWVDLVIDPGILAKSNRPRNRRLLFLFALLAGSFVGAFAYNRIRSGFVLLMAGVGKTIVTAGFLINKEEESASVWRVRDKSNNKVRGCFRFLINEEDSSRVSSLRDKADRKGGYLCESPNSSRVTDKSDQKRGCSGFLTNKEEETARGWSVRDKPDKKRGYLGESASTWRVTDKADRKRGYMGESANVWRVTDKPPKKRGCLRFLINEEVESSASSWRGTDKADEIRGWFGN